MGSNSASISFRGVSQEQVVKALLEQRVSGNCFVSPEKDNWVTMFAEGCCDSYEEDIVRIGRTICGACHCPGIAIDLEDSWVLSYWLFDRDGNLADESYQEEVPEEEEGRSFESAHGLLGNPDMIPEVLGLDLSPKVIREALGTDHLFREDNMHDLCSLLGIPFFDATYSAIEEYRDTEEFEHWNLREFVWLRRKEEVTKEPPRNHPDDWAPWARSQPSVPSTAWRRRGQDPKTKAPGLFDEPNSIGEPEAGDRSGEPDAL